MVVLFGVVSIIFKPVYGEAYKLVIANIPPILLLKNKSPS